MYRIAAILLGLCIVFSVVIYADAQSQIGASPPVQSALAGEREVRCDKEAKCVAELHGMASRSGDVLILKLDNGITKTFRSNRKACDESAENCELTILIGYMPPQHMFVLKQIGLDIVGFVAVSGQNGKSFQLEAEPHLSPDGKRFVVVAADEMNGWQRDVAIFSTLSFPPKLQWGYKTRKPDEYALYSFLGWDGNGRIRLSVSIDGKEAETDATRTPEGWKLRLANGEYRMGNAAAQ